MSRVRGRGGALPLAVAAWAATAAARPLPASCGAAGRQSRGKHAAGDIAHEPVAVRAARLAKPRVPAGAGKTAGPCRQPPPTEVERSRSSGSASWLSDDRPRCPGRRKKTALSCAARALAVQRPRFMPRRGSPRGEILVGPVMLGIDLRSRCASTSVRNTQVGCRNHVLDAGAPVLVIRRVVRPERYGKFRRRFPQQPSKFDIIPRGARLFTLRVVAASTEV